MTIPIGACAWSGEVRELAETLAAAARLPVSSNAKPSGSLDLETAVFSLGLETEPIQITGSNCRMVLQNSVPGILEHAGSFTGVLRARGEKLWVVCPDRVVRKISAFMVEEELLDGVADRLPNLNPTLDACRLQGRRRAQTRRALLREYAQGERLATFWELRSSPGTPFGAQVRNLRLEWMLAIAAAAHALEYGVWITSWFVLGRSLLAGRLDQGWLQGWVLLLAAIVPLRMMSRWAHGKAGIGISGLLKQRLMAGASRIQRELVGIEGPGGLLGRVLESEVIENLAVNSGFNSVLGVAELMVAAAILSLVPGTAPALAALLVSSLAGGVLTWQYVRRRVPWTSARLSITRDLIERLAGYRTVLAQLPRARWHEAEDSALASYARDSHNLDRIHNALLHGISPAWMVLGTACLTPMFLAGHSAGPLAAALGGVLLARSAFSRITLGVADVASASIAFQQVLPVFKAAPQPGGGTVRAIPDDKPAHLDARDLQFAYDSPGEPVLSSAALTAAAGEHIIVGGAPAAGRTTLGNILAGLEHPKSGLVLFSGLDSTIWGDRLQRRMVAMAPQSRDNHIFTGTVAFNLLMGRRWPPGESDMADARSICRELGLAPLLERMPSELEQMIGNSGWQLSEGERVRLFVGRCILQGTSVVILDDALTALDAQTRLDMLSWLSHRPETVILLTAKNFW